VRRGKQGGTERVRKGKKEGGRDGRKERGGEGGRELVTFSSLPFSSSMTM